MKMKTMTGCRVITCSLECSKDMVFDLQIPCPYQSDTIRYAVCRYLVKTGEIRHELVSKSYDMRFTKRRTCRRTFLIPATEMELPAGWVELICVVSPKGVVIERITLMRSRPERRRPGKVYG